MRNINIKYKMKHTMKRLRNTSNCLLPHSPNVSLIQRINPYTIPRITSLYFSTSSSSTVTNIPLSPSPSSTTTGPQISSSSTTTTQSTNTTSSSSSTTTHFGYQTVDENEKAKLVEGVFRNVANT